MSPVSLLRSVGGNGPSIPDAANLHRVVFTPAGKEKSQ